MASNTNTSKRTRKLSKLKYELSGLFNAWTFKMTVDYAL